MKETSSLENNTQLSLYIADDFWDVSKTWLVYVELSSIKVPSTMR